MRHLAICDCQMIEAISLVVAFVLHDGRHKVLWSQQAAWSAKTKDEHKCERKVNTTVSYNKYRANNVSGSSVDR